MGLQTFDETQAWCTIMGLGDGAGTGTLSINGFGLGSGRIDNFLLCNTGLTDRTVQVTVQNGGDTIVLAEIVVPAGAGVGGVPPVDGFAAAFPASVTSLLVAAGVVFLLGVTVALLAGTFVYIYLSGGSV